LIAFIRSIVLCCLGFLLIQPLAAQEKHGRFTWFTKQEEKQTGVLRMAAVPADVESRFVIQISVVWYNQQGLEIIAEDQKPFVYLSEYDYLVQPAGHAICRTFADPGIYQVYFQEQGELVFDLKGDPIDLLTIRFAFQYAFSESDINIGRTNKLEFQEGDRFMYEIATETLIKEDDEQDDQQNVDEYLAAQLLSCQVADSCLNAFLYTRDRLRILNDSLDLESELSDLGNQVTALTIGDTSKISSITTEIQLKNAETASFIASIDQALEQTRQIRRIITDESVPPDSSSIYLRRMDNASLELRSMKNAYTDYGIQFRNLLNNMGIQTAPENIDNQKEYLLSTYEPIFQRQIDSSVRIREKHAVLLIDLEPELYEAPSLAIDNAELDSLIGLHNLLTGQLNDLEENHQAVYMQYVTRIGETGNIVVLDSLHASFTASFDIGYGSIQRIDERISSLMAKIDQLTTRNDYSVLYYGGGGLVLLILLFIVQQIRRQRKRPISATPIAQGSTTMMRQNGDILELIDKETLAGTEHYPFIPPASLESVVAEVQFSFRSIKGIYQLVQGAITRKNPLDMGAYLFGRQYKATGTRAGQSILIIDYVISSSALRHDVDMGIAGGQDVVDELDQIVSDNKKSVLLGWLSAIASADLTMSESFVKTHRTFFREKWQLALLINPGTDGLTSAVFLRRKSGFFDPVPDDDLLLSFEDLYQYVINPPINGKSDQEESKPDPSQYISVDLNQKWCDSIVQNISILPDVLVNLRKRDINLVIPQSGELASGYFYGRISQIHTDGQPEYQVFIDRFVEMIPGDTPRVIPGFQLLGALYLLDQEIFESLKKVLPKHQDIFKEAYQVCVIVNISTGELRIFSRKHSLEMNNNVIETEEFNLNDLVLTAMKAK